MLRILIENIHHKTNKKFQSFVTVCRDCMYLTQLLRLSSTAFLHIVRQHCISCEWLCKFTVMSCSNELLKINLIH